MQYPDGVIAPVVTKRLEMIVQEMDGNKDKMQIAQEIQTLPIADSKFIRNSIREAEPRLDLEKRVFMPRQEKK